MLAHISNNYLGSTVHASLTNSLSRLGVGAQFVYCPLQRSFSENPAVQAVAGVRVSSPRIFNQLIRYFPLFKTVWAFCFFLIALKKYNIKPRFIIAHTLWSDGMVAWLYNKMTGTPFLVAVRNTDVNHFLPRLPHYRWLIKSIVKASDGVVFINNVYQRRMEERYPKVFHGTARVVTIYNGVDDEWLRLAKSVPPDTRELTVCFVGRFLLDKNIKNSVLAIKKLRDAGQDIKYIAIGGSHESFLRVTGLAEVPSWITVLPHVTSRAEIAKHLRRARVFLMPSFKETFGLVYIEALTQGCCLIHAKGEGIDGVFNEPFVRAADPNSVDDIALKVSELIALYPRGVPYSHVATLTAPFSWEIIANKYLGFVR